MRDEHMLLLAGLASILICVIPVLLFGTATLINLVYFLAGISFLFTGYAAGTYRSA